MIISLPGWCRVQHLCLVRVVRVYATRMSRLFHRLLVVAAAATAAAATGTASVALYDHGTCAATPWKSAPVPLDSCVSAQGMGIISSARFACVSAGKTLQVSWYDTPDCSGHVTPVSVATSRCTFITDLILADVTCSATGDIAPPPLTDKQQGLLLKALHPAAGDLLPQQRP